MDLKRLEYFCAIIEKGQISKAAQSLDVYKRQALCAFSTPPSSIFPQKIKKMLPNRRKGAPASYGSVFQPAVCDDTSSPTKCKAFHAIFHAILLQYR